VALPPDTIRDETTGYVNYDHNNAVPEWDPGGGPKTNSVYGKKYNYAELSLDKVALVQYI